MAGGGTSSSILTGHRSYQTVRGNELSKEWPGSIVNETLKNGILILKDISKELDFHADFKYISFIQFSLCHQKLRAWENLPFFGKHPLKS